MTTSRDLMNSDSSLSSALACVGGLLFFVTVCYLTKPRRVPEEYHRGALIRQQAREVWARRRREMNLADPSLRDRLIQRALYVQQILAQDDNNRFLLGPEQEKKVVFSESSSSEREASSSHHRPDEEESACVICLELFRVGDVVAWSREEELKCRHCFHRECIHMWFTKHDDCPSCRKIMLNPENDTADDVETGEQKSQCRDFAILNGLISEVKHGSDSILNCNTFDTEDDSLEDNTDDSLLGKDSPMRRVVSYGDPLINRTPPTRRLVIFGKPGDDDDNDSKSEQVDSEDDITIPSPLRRVVSYNSPRRRSIFRDV